LAWEASAFEQEHSSPSPGGGDRGTGAGGASSDHGEIEDSWLLRVRGRWVGRSVHAYCFQAITPMR